MRQKRIFYFRSKLNLCFVSVFIFMCAFTAFATDFISDEPMDSIKVTPPSNVMFILDDSCSMDWETITDEAGGRIDGKGYMYTPEFFNGEMDRDFSNTRTLFPEALRPKWKSQWFGYNKGYYNPNVNYMPWPYMTDADTTTPRSNPVKETPTVNIGDTYFSVYPEGAARKTVIVDNNDGLPTYKEVKLWQDSGAGPYYSGGSRYTEEINGIAKFIPTIPETGAYKISLWWACHRKSDQKAQVIVNSDDVQYTQTFNQRGAANKNGITRPGFCGEWIRIPGTFNFSAGSSNDRNVKIKRTGSSTLKYTQAEAAKFELIGGAGAVDVLITHYFLLDDVDKNGEKNGSEKLYLVIINGGVREYYEVNDDNGMVEDSELVSIPALPPHMIPMKKDEQGNPVAALTDAEDLQNFANWFSYYRKREFAAKAALSRAITQFTYINVGLYTINDNQVKQQVLPIKVDSNVIIVDNDDGAYSELAGTWNDSNASGSYNGTARYTSSVNGIARWTPFIPAEDKYNIFAWWDCFDNRDKKARFSITHKGGTNSVVLNQRNETGNNTCTKYDSGDTGTCCGTWVKIGGPYTLEQGNTSFVEVERMGDGGDYGTSTVADAIMFEPESADGTYDKTSDLLNALYYSESDTCHTPLRVALKGAGEYFLGKKADIGPSPYATAANGGTCQRSFAILTTDGYDTREDPNLDAPKNQDGDKGHPYADTYDSTIADVAMHYYTIDLAPNLADQVPTSPCDDNYKQHMVTYSVAFGVYGSRKPTEQDLRDPCWLEGDSHPIPGGGWPDPGGSNKSYRIDDLWHAAINGRGLFFSASDPQDLVNAMLEIMIDITDDDSSGSSASADGEQIQADPPTVMYQAQYFGDWTGDLVATTLTKDGTPDVEKWHARAELEKPAFDWDQRNIVTYNGTTGKSFSTTNLTSTQKEKLDANWDDADPTIAGKAIAKITNMVRFIRGDMDIWSTAGFREREARLGDIVHSSPALYDGVIFAGANDGMLHAFSEATGQELFAYIPNLVFDNLAELTRPNYLHKFFVDQTPYIRSVGTKTYLIGGLGKGGKGYYALDITLASTASTENDAAATVLWEYPNATPDDDLGYTFSNVGIVRTNSASYPILVIFGNGYQSTSGKAMLYFMDLEGNVVRQIDTKYDGGNGLSSPTLLDTNNDQKADYAYAGDLKGNLWKFDLTSDDESEWKVAFYDSTTPKPLFQARSNQAITTKPAVTRHCTQHGYLVTFGTGKYLGEKDRDETYTGVQSFYGIWDYGDDSDDTEYLGTFDKDATQQLSNQDATVSLLEQTVIYKVSDGNDGLGVLSDNTAVWATTADDKEADGEKPNPIKHVGWFFDLPIENERVIKDPIIRDGNVIFISFIPANSPCEGGGDSIFNELDVCDGSRIAEPNFDINDDKEIDETDTVEVATNVLLPPSRKQFIGIMLHSPLILEMNPTEDDGGGDENRDAFIFSTSEPAPQTMIHKGVETGMFYWRQR